MSFATLAGWLVRSLSVRLLSCRFINFNLLLNNFYSQSFLYYSLKKCMLIITFICRMQLGDNSLAYSADSGWQLQKKKKCLFVVALLLSSNKIDGNSGLPNLYFWNLNVEVLIRMIYNSFALIIFYRISIFLNDR